MRASTKVLLKKHGWRIDIMLHNYLYFLFYYPYVRGVYHLFRFLANYLYWFKPLSPVLKAAFNRYHAKVLSFDNTKKIFELNEDIDAISDKNKKIIPFKYAHKILFKEADYIAVMDCPCKKTLNAPASTINSCIAVGRGTAEFWIDACGKKYNARRISQQEALAMIQDFRRQGYLNQAFFKVATGGSTGVICNCHVDSCVSLQATLFARKFNKEFSMQAESGYSVRQSDSLCEHCGRCASRCQFGAIAITDDEWSYQKDLCLGCELCVEHCPNNALSLYRDRDKAVPLDLDIVKAKFARSQGLNRALPGPD